MNDDFRLLYEAHYEPMCRIAWRILGEKETSREIVQEIFINIWEKEIWKTLDSPKAYLYTAVHHRAINELKKSRRFSSEDAMQNIAVTDADLNDETALQKAIETAIDSLPEQCKRIFLLSREEEMSYKQIAAHLGLSIKTVERQVGIALEKLRTFINRNYP